jgi:hypothetical protein
METVKTTAFKCEFCRKRYFVAATCKYHELVCKKRKENQHACWNCFGLTKVRVDFDDGNNVEDEQTCYTFYCKKRNKYLYSNKAKINKHIVIKYPCYDKGKEIEHELMPLECEFSGLCVHDFSNK